MKGQYGVVRAPLIASLALALVAAPLGVVWAQSSDDHQHDAHSSSAEHRGAPPEAGARAPRNAGPPTSQHSGGGAPGGAGGHFSVTPRFHAPPARQGATAAPPRNFRPAPQLSPQPSRTPGGGTPAFRARQGGSNAAPPRPDANAGPSRGGRENGFANGGRDARAGQGERGFAPNHDRDGGFDADRRHDGRLAVRRPEERHYDRDHWEDHRHWDGGYWNGRYWPAIHDRADFVWLLPSLPVGYVIYSWDGVPYYYYDDTYYTWDPAYNGYVATEPPPVAVQTEQPEEPEQAEQPESELYAYPTRGQSPEQQAEDRQECQQWAYSQSPSADDGYQRALKACLTARGYSVD